MRIRLKLRTPQQCQPIEILNKRCRTTTRTAGFVLALAWNLSAATPPTCDPGNGGLQLPPGFCALVVADNIGPARHIAVAPNGDIYVALQANGRKGGVVALRDADGDGRFEIKQRIGQDSVTGVALRNGYLYLAKFHSVERCKMAPGELTPAGTPEIVVSGLPGVEEHGDKGIAFDGQGGLYVNIGAPSNACQPKNRRAKVPGQDPCQLLEKHGGIWKFSENKLGQKQEDGTRFATGLRQMPAIAWDHGALYIAMNNRDQLDTLWPGLFTARENAERPAEPLFRAEAGANFGWPLGNFEIFAAGFAGATPLTNPDKAVARADGVAVAPDGSLYISESQHGKIWRVIYRASH